MISILLATGFEKLDNTLTKYFTNDSNIEFFNQRVYFREGLGDSIERNNPDIVLLSDKLDGNTLSLEQLIRITRKRHSGTRIVFILSNKDNVRIRKLLYQLNVFDIFALEPKLNIKEMYNSFLHPKEWKDVANKFPDLDEENFDLDEELLFNSDEGITIEDEYSPFQTNLKQTLTRGAHTTAAFWSIRQQSGTTFLAINTALLLSQHKEQKVLLIDFNPNNPNIHIQFNLMDPDGNRNLAALCEDIESNTIKNVSEMDDYLVTHPYYANLKVMLGLILKNKKPSQETLIKAFHMIIEYANNEGYTSILFDLESGLEEAFIIEVIKTIDVAITPITEKPGNYIAIQKIFDREFGPFFLNFLDLKKIHPIINRSLQSENSPKMQHLLQSFLHRKIEVIIPQDEDIYNSVEKASPILKREPHPDILRSLSITANYIQNIFEVPLLEEKKKPEKRRFGLF